MTVFVKFQIWLFNWTANGGLPGYNGIIRHNTKIHISHKHIVLKESTAHKAMIFHYNPCSGSQVVSCMQTEWWMVWMDLKASNSVVKQSDIKPLAISIVLISGSKWTAFTRSFNSSALTSGNSILLLFNWTANGFSPGGSGTKRRHNTQKYTYHTK
jgi:hypothetical protein